MDAIPVGRAVLLKVVDKLGGATMAAEHLGIPLTLIRRYLDGKISVPDGVLLQAVDIVLGDPFPAEVQILRSVKATAPVAPSGGRTDAPYDSKRLSTPSSPE